jgi:hypothetical protein
MTAADDDYARGRALGTPTATELKLVRSARRKAALDRLLPVGVDGREASGGETGE